MNSVPRIASWAVALVVALPAGLEIGSPATASPPEAGASAAQGGSSGPAGSTPAGGAAGAITAAPPSPAPPTDPPELAALRAAFLSADPDELARAGARLAARRLAGPLSGGDRELALAAAAAAPSAPDAVWLLELLGQLAGSADRPIAAAASRAAARIAGAVDLDALLVGDVPLDWVRARAAEYRSRAADPGRWADVRVASLEVAAHLVRALGERATPADSPYDLAAVLADPEPELRRAGVELAPTPLSPDALRLIATRAGSDDDPAVAAAAVLAVCEGLAFGDPAGPVMAALGSRGLARARALASFGDLPDGARDAAARCVTAGGDRASEAK